MRLVLAHDHRIVIRTRLTAYGCLVKNPVNAPVTVNGPRSG
jgi:hypothetical protein